MALQKSANNHPLLISAPVPGTTQPASMGILALGITTGLASLYSIGLLAADSKLLKTGLIWGGFWLILIGILEWRRNSLLGATAFTSFGLFWLSLVAMILLPAGGWGRAPQPSSLAAYLSVWGMFSAVLCCGSRQASRFLGAFFGVLTAMIALLAIGQAMGHQGIKLASGYVGLAGGLLATWVAFAKLIRGKAVAAKQKNQDQQEPG